MDCAMAVSRTGVDGLEEDEGSELRLCDGCAVHYGLRVLFQEENLSDFILPATSDEESNGEEEEGKTVSNEAHPFHFSWGLYVLLSVVAPPRTCVNPSCPHPFSYRAECPHCNLPTLPSSILFDGEKYRVLPGAELSLPSVKSVDLPCLSSFEKRHTNVQKRRIAELKREDAECYAATAFPHIFGLMKKEVFPSSSRSPPVVEGGKTEGSVMLRSFTIPPSSPSTSMTMMTLLSLVAVQVAEVPPPLSGCRLNTCDYPLAPLLALRESKSTHCALDYVGGSVAYFVFRTGEYTAMHARMKSSMMGIEVWRRKPTSRDQGGDHNSGGGEELHTQLLAESIGFFSPDSSTAKEAGGVEKLFQVFALRSLVEELDTPKMEIIKNELVTLRKAGVHLVLCGHGMGGAMATLLTLQLLVEHTDLMCPSEDEKGIHCITFGAPVLIGGMDCIQLLEDMNLTSCFHHFVYRGDLVPRFHLLDVYLDGNTATEQLGCPISEETKEGLQKMLWDWMYTQQPIHGRFDAELKVSPSGADDHKNEKRKKESPTTRQETKLAALALHDIKSTGDGLTSDRKEWGCNGDVFCRLREPFDGGLPSTPSEPPIPRSPHNSPGKIERTEMGKQQLPIMSSFTALFHPSDPLLFGCYHCFSLEPDKMYQFCHSKSDPVRELLSYRRSLRVLFGDHVIPQYTKAILEYINSCNATS